MLTSNGSQLLKEFTEKTYKKTVLQPVPGVWFVLGLGHSNAIFLEAESSVLLIDTLDTLERGQQLKEIIREQTKKEVKTIFYTHIHPDHRGGAGAFADSQPEIIAFAPKTPVLEKTGLLKDIQGVRGARQFGYGLTDEEAISQGIGIREGIVYGEQRAFVPPTTVYDEDRICRTFDGIPAELLRLPGEADDQMMLWFPERKVLCCGDNYYGCFPNLYAIRGGQYRDLAAWIHSIDVLRSYPASVLLPGHTAALIGQETIQETLTSFRDAFDFLLTQTLHGMNAGKTADQLAAEIALPETYQKLPYLAEHYGCVEWTVRSIYTAYLGWFDGNPTRLHPLSPSARAGKTIALMGGDKAVFQAAAQTAAQAEDVQDYAWCLELCDLLIDWLSDRTDASAPDAAPDPDFSGISARDVRLLKARVLEAMAEYETSANGRHYYQVCAKELRGE